MGEGCQPLVKDVHGVVVVVVTLQRLAASNIAGNGKWEQTSRP